MALAYWATTGPISTATLIRDVTDQDADGDGYVNVFYAGQDCNDFDATVNPDADEIVYDQGKTTTATPIRPTTISMATDTATRSTATTSTG